MNYQRNSTGQRRGISAHGARFVKKSGNGRFRGSGRFGAKSAKPAIAKLDISAFINKRTEAAGVPAPRFVPEHSFRDFALSAPVVAAVQKKGYDQPTPIQDKIIPSIMQGRDVVGLANTGTGKTAAFLIPLVEKVLRRSDEQVLVVTPTRELAGQIEQELKSIAKYMPVYSVTCVGGESLGLQIQKLKHRNHFVIGTPGRLIDLIQRGVLRLGETRTVVLDEADRMLDMGFIDPIREILGKMPAPRQCLLFSATMPLNIERLIKDFLNDPVRVSVKTHETPDTIEQDVIRIGSTDKTDALHDLLKGSDLKKVLVFGKTKHGVERLCRKLVERGVRSESIHGNKTQSQRQRALQKFKEGRCQALIATDVAARGLDIDGVTHVVNYDLPNTYDDYIHRIGRTGRGTHKGKALTFVD